jgi:hypothetical protein
MARHASLPFLIIMTLAAAASAGTVDSGWTPIFNGKNFDGLYLRSGRAELKNPAASNQVRIESDGSLYLPTPSPAGAICTKADLSYYHARIRYHFPSASGTPNAGMLYHVDSLDWLPTDAFGSSTVDRVPSLQPSCGGSWFPKSWEAQMRRGQSGAVYGVANVWGETTVKDGKWDPAGAPFSIVPAYSGSNKFVNPSQGDWPDGPDNWVTLEVLVYGADSAIHVVNGKRVFKMTRMRHNRIMVPCGQGGGTWGTGAQLPMATGKHCVQIEGASMTYRDWEMRPLPWNGGPTTVAEAPRASGYSVQAQRLAGSRAARIDLRIPSGHRSPLRLEAFTPRGGLLRAFRPAGGSETVAWDLTDEAGRPVGPGLVVIRLTAPGISASARLLLD